MSYSEMNIMMATNHLEAKWHKKKSILTMRLDQVALRAQKYFLVICQEIIAQA